MLASRLLALAAAASFGLALTSADAAAVTVRVDTSLRDQNVHAAGVWIGRHGAAWYQQTSRLQARIPSLRCSDDETAAARLSGPGVVFHIAGLAQTGSCERDAVERTDVRGRGSRVRLERGTIRVGRRTPAVVRRRLTYLRETPSTVTYGVSRLADVCHPGQILQGGGWQVTLTVSKRTHDVTTVRVRSGVLEVACP